MKKTLSVLVMAAIMLSVFFCIPVNAANAHIYTRVNASDIQYQGTGGNFLMSCYAMQLYPITSTSLEGGVTQQTIINVHFANNTDQDIYLADVWFKPSYGSDGYIQSWDNISTDLFIRSANSSGVFYIGANESLAYGNGFIIPSHSAVDMVAVLNNEATFSTSSGDAIGNQISGITSGISAHVFGSYPHGESVDLSPITDYLSTIDQNIDDSVDVLENIRTLMTWTGSMPTSSYSPRSTNTYKGTFIENLTWQLEVNYNGCFPVIDSVDFEPPDDIYSNQVYKHQFSIFVYVNNNTGKNITADNYFKVNGIQATSSDIIDIEMQSFYSDVFVNPYFSSYWSDFFCYIDKGSQVLLPSYSRFVLTLNYYSKSSVKPSLYGTPALSYGGTFSESSNDLNDASDDIATQSDQIHSQEAAYYQQNSAAIQATGLSNYQFDASAVSGLTGVRGDFIDVWNSLGGWNTVYIFSLTLGLALTILRHSPSAISSIVRRKNQGDYQK